MPDKFLQSKEKGIALYFSILLLSMILGFSLAAFSIIFYQIRIAREFEESVMAFYAAESGAEETMYNDLVLGNAPDRNNISLPNGTYYDARIRCNPTYSCPYPSDANCVFPRYCVTSTGAFRQTQRAIEINY